MIYGLLYLKDMMEEVSYVLDVLKRWHKKRVLTYIGNVGHLNSHQISFKGGREYEREYTQGGIRYPEKVG